MSQQLSRRVKNYIRYRPRYPQAVLNLLKADCGLKPTHRIADIGCGTGLLAELFLQHGNAVFGVEPDPDMLAGAKHFLRDYLHFSPVAASAEATTLPDRRVDFVTAGQAFHWFNLEDSRKEFKRILAPDGWVVLVWNVQRSKGTPFLEALQVFWETRDFWKSPSPNASHKEENAQAYRLSFELARQELLEPFFRDGFEEKVFQNPMACDYKGLKGRILSNASALAPDDPNYARMLEALIGIFEAHQKNGKVTIQHDTRVVYGRL